MSAPSAGGLAASTASGAATGAAAGPWGAAIGAGIGALSSIGGSMLSGGSSNAASAEAQRVAFKNSVKFLGLQQDWDKTVRLNNHQWEVRDLRKAGLNPILSAHGGASGSAVGGFAASAPSHSYQSPNIDIGERIANAVQLAQNDRRIKNETVLAAAQAAKDISQGKLNSDNAALAREQILTQKTIQSANSASASRELASVPVQGALAKYYHDGAAAALASANQSNASADNMRLQNQLMDIEKSIQTEALPATKAMAPIKAVAGDNVVTNLLGLILGGGLVAGSGRFGNLARGISSRRSSINDYFAPQAVWPNPGRNSKYR